MVWRSLEVCKSKQANTMAGRRYLLSPWICNPLVFEVRIYNPPHHFGSQTLILRNGGLQIHLGKPKDMFILIRSEGSQKKQGCRLLVRYGGICEKLPPPRLPSLVPLRHGDNAKRSPLQQRIKRKTLIIYQIINVFRFISERNRTVRSGARGSRTLVQTGKPYAFYTHSHR